MELVSFLKPDSLQENFSLMGKSGQGLQIVKSNMQNKQYEGKYNLFG
jgi:hypothetical protein